MSSALHACKRMALGGAIAALAAACSSADSTPMSAGDTWWYGGSAGTSGSGGYFANGGGAGAAGDDAAALPVTFNPLCGVRTCDPGYRRACGQTSLPPPPEDANATPAPQDAGTSDADAATDARADVGLTDARADAGLTDARADAATDAATDASASRTVEAGAAGALAPATEAGTAVADATPDVVDAGPADGPAPAFGCYIQKTGAELVPTCAPAGNAAEFSSCDDSHDCSPGLGCVDPSVSTECGSSLGCNDAALAPRGECRQLYCSLPVTCPAQTFYQELPLRVLGETSPYKVPVCMPVDGCDLLSSTPCSAGRVCTIVGDNATTCLLPGTAQRDEPCDDLNRCAEGLVCSKSTNTCLKLCRTGSTDCPGGTCQGGSAAFPQGFGVCLGDDRDASTD